MPAQTARPGIHPVALTFAAVVLTAIVVLSFLPATVVEPGKWNLGHAPAYAALAASMIFALARTQRTPVVVILIGLAASLLGGTIEFMQPLVGRSTSLVDFGYNELGIVTALAIFASYARVTGHTGWRRT